MSIKDVIKCEKKLSCNLISVTELAFTKSIAYNKLSRDFSFSNFLGAEKAQTLPKP